MTIAATSMAAPDLSAFDPYGRAFQQDPYPWFEAMRAAAPFYVHEPTGLGFVTRYDLVSAMLKDPATYSSAFGVTPNEPPSADVADAIAEIKRSGWVRPPVMLTVDPPDHTRYRATVARWFNARAISALRPAIEAVVDEELDRVIGVGPLDVADLFSIPVPVRVIMVALNLTPGREDDLKRWSDATTAGIGGHLSPERAIEAARETVELQHYLHDELVDRQRNPRDDVLTHLVQSELPLPDGGSRPLEIEELMAIFQHLLGAGNETTTKLFAQMLRWLAESPEEWAKLRADPGRAPAVVEEALRLASPTQGMFRVVTRDVEVAGVPLARGARVVLMYSAANRDPAVFGDPHRFDPDRPNARDHLAFGAGTHFCIGAPLSRLEGAVALERLARRCREIRLDPANTYAYEPSFLLRGLSRLVAELVPDDSAMRGA